MVHDHQEWVIVRDLHKKICYIALDYDLELSDEDIFLHRRFVLHGCLFFQPISLTLKPAERRTLPSATS